MIEPLFFRFKRGWRAERLLSWQTAVLVAAFASLAFLLLLRFRLWYAAPLVFLFVLYVMGEIRYLRPGTTFRLVPQGKEVVETAVEQVLYEKGLPYQYENGRFLLEETPLTITAVSQASQTKLLITPVTRDHRPLIQSLQARLNDALSGS